MVSAMQAVDATDLKLMALYVGVGYVFAVGMVIGSAHAVANDDYFDLYHTISLKDFWWAVAMWLPIVVVLLLGLVGAPKFRSKVVRGFRVRAIVTSVSLDQEPGEPK
jgi:hypothetical protein